MIASEGGEEEEEEKDDDDEADEVQSKSCRNGNRRWMARSFVCLFVFWLWKWIF